MDMDDSSHVSIILGIQFLTSVGAVIDVQAGTLSFQLDGERVDLCFPPPTPSLVPAIFVPPDVPVNIVPLDVISQINVFVCNGEPHIRFISSSDFYAPI